MATGHCLLLGVSFPLPTVQAYWGNANIALFCAGFLIEVLVFASRKARNTNPQLTASKLHNLAGYEKRKGHHSPTFMFYFSEMRSPSPCTIFAIFISTCAVCSNGFGIVPFTSANSIVSR